ncbi:hypothetical protein [uncultured Tateyamaria sp.]|uniref:hypothetical protein n=1 Tax=uncultured Tateyamaria sp. TaxID=455651 RepID=UPI00262EF8C6|nr:hypothetical protein [uncultured Tateyamaria sp.]
MDGDKNLGTLFQSWTVWTGWGISVLILGAGVLGLVLSLASFVNMFRHVQEQDGSPKGMAIPVGHILAVIIAGMISVSGVWYGVMSLLWSPAGTAP